MCSESTSRAGSDREDPTCLIGVDNYSYHRLLGEVRSGEVPPAKAARTWLATLAAAHGAGAKVVSLQTCFMSIAEAERSLRQLDDRHTCLAWGHPAGLEFGRLASAETDAGEWMRLARDLGHSRMRIVTGHQSVAVDADRRRDLRDAIPALARLASLAEDLSLTLAIENHTDFTAAQLRSLLEEVDSPRLSVCFDLGNAFRVGDDVQEAAELLRENIVMVHVKDLVPGPLDGPSGPASTLLGEGVLPIGPVIDSLGSIDEVWLLLELGHLGAADVDEDAMVQQGVAWLNDRLRMRIRRTP